MINSVVLQLVIERF